MSPGFVHHACELARPTAGIAALTFLETAATCWICHVKPVPEPDLKFMTTCFFTFRRTEIERPAPHFSRALVSEQSLDQQHLDYAAAANLAARSGTKLRNTQP
jgi:hypothetical protein